MAKSDISKMVKKGAAYWKHSDKRNGKVDIMMHQNKKEKKRPKAKPLDLSKQDWSTE